MPTRIGRALTAIALAAMSLAGAGVATAGAQTRATAWSHFGGSTRGRQYSSLAQITRGNVARLERVWTYRTGERGTHAQQAYSFQANPIHVAGRLYLVTGGAVVIALDPESGEELWRFDAHLDRSRRAAEISNRGVTSWVDPEAPPGAHCRHRIFVGTLDARMIALDGATGTRCESFGTDGRVRLDRGVRAGPPAEMVQYTVTSPPVIVDDVLVTGSAIGDNRGVALELGVVRGLDARTGEELWRWDPIPRTPGEPGFDAWRPHEAQQTGAANAWAPLAADRSRGLVYVPTGSASPDYYGGERAGANPHANSVVALRAATGELVWARQLVHHDVWDYDVASQPTLANLRRDGRSIPALIQGTKMGLVFTLDRRTGEAIFPIFERAVPQGGAPGEHLAPTQPFPVKPPPLVRTEPVEPDDAWGLLWFDERACRKRLAVMRSEGLYTPPSRVGTVQLPGYSGGINWGGVAFDPASQTAVTFATNMPFGVTLIPRAAYEHAARSDAFPNAEFGRQAGTPYGVRRGPLFSPLGVPCIAPPWGKLVALDMRDASILWQRPLGTIEDMAPAIVPNLELGTPGMGGPIVTGGGLVFIGAAMDDYLRAFDLASGEQLWRGRLPAGGQATPMTYRGADGRQYVVIAAGGHPALGTTPGDYIVAFALDNP